MLSSSVTRVFHLCLRLTVFCQERWPPSTAEVRHAMQSLSQHSFILFLYSCHSANSSLPMCCSTPSRYSWSLGPNSPSKNRAVAAWMLSNTFGPWRRHHVRRISDADLNCCHRDLVSRWRVRNSGCDRRCRGGRSWTCRLPYGAVCPNKPAMI